MRRPATCLPPQGIIGVDADEGADHRRAAGPPLHPVSPAFRSASAISERLFAAIRQTGLIVHHPYESFDVVVDFLRQAAAEPGRGCDQGRRLPHQQRQPDRQGAGRGAEAGKSVTAIDRIEGALRRGGKHPLAHELERPACRWSTD